MMLFNRVLIRPKYLLLGLLVGVSLTATGMYLYKDGYKQGFNDAVGVCFSLQPPVILIDEERGFVVQCRPLTRISPEELEQRRQSKKEQA